jgi:hypothetical protein
VRWGVGVAATLAGGGLAFWVLGSIFAAVVTGVIVAGAYALITGRGGSADEDAAERERRQRYIAKLMATVRFSDERATDIERLVPFPPPPPDSNGNKAENGDGNGQTQAAFDALKKEIAAERRSVGGVGDDV